MQTLPGTISIRTSQTTRSVGIRPSLLACACLPAVSDDEHIRTLEEQWIDSMDTHAESMSQSSTRTAILNGIIIGFFFPILPFFFLHEVKPAVFWEDGTDHNVSSRTIFSLVLQSPSVAALLTPYPALLQEAHQHGSCHRSSHERLIRSMDILVNFLIYCRRVPWGCRYVPTFDSVLNSNKSPSSIPRLSRTWRPRVRCMLVFTSAGGR